VVTAPSPLPPPLWICQRYHFVWIRALVDWLKRSLLAIYWTINVSLLCYCKSSFMISSCEKVKMLYLDFIRYMVSYVSDLIMD
jgi:hypothetical protein